MGLGPCLDQRRPRPGGRRAGRGAVGGDPSDALHREAAAARDRPLHRPDRKAVGLPSARARRPATPAEEVLEASIPSRTRSTASCVPTGGFPASGSGSSSSRSASRAARRSSTPTCARCAHTKGGSRSRPAWPRQECPFRVVSTLLPAHAPGARECSFDATVVSATFLPPTGQRRPRPPHGDRAGARPGLPWTDGSRFSAHVKPSHWRERRSATSTAGSSSMSTRTRSPPGRGNPAVALACAGSPHRPRRPCARRVARPGRRRRTRQERS